MSLGQSIRSGVKWLAFGKLGNRFFEFAFGIALARLLVPADFGMIATIQIFTGFVGMFVAGGMGQSLIRAKTADESDFTAVFTAQLMIGAAVYGAFFVGAPLVARFFEEPLYTDLLRVSALTFLLRPLVTMRNAWLNRAMEFKSRTLVDVATSFFGGAVSVTLALMGLGVWSLTLAGLIGALFNYVWIARLTPLRLRINLDRQTIGKHASYGMRLVGNDFVDYLRGQSRLLIMSKLAGPAFVGLFNKADSLARLPNQILMSPTMEPMFRAMSKSQDDLEQVKNLYYRAITLLMAYTAPAYVLLWWIAEPFITVVYGSNWSPAGAPMSIMTVAGLFLNVALPSSVLLAVRNRLGQEMLASAINLPILAGSVYVGLQWGLTGVACASVFAQAVFTAQLQVLVLRALPTRLSDLMRAVGPGLMLGTATFAVLAGAHALVGNWAQARPAAYVLAMSAAALAGALAAIRLLPFPVLREELERWSTALGAKLSSWRQQRREPAEGRSTTRPEDTVANVSINDRHPNPMKKPSMLKTSARWGLLVAVVAALAAALYSARTDLAPLVHRAIAMEWRVFKSDTLPVNPIVQIYDMGVVDANGDGHLDLYTSNHNYRQYLFLGDAGGNFRDVVGEWKLDQIGALPGAEQTMAGPKIDKPGLYIYWVGDTLHLQFHQLETLGAAKGSIRFFNRSTTVRNEGVELSGKVVPAGAIGESQLEFSAPRSGHLVLYLLTRGSPVRFTIDAPWARNHTFVGHAAVVPAGAATAVAAGCPQCLEFEMMLRDRHSMAWADLNGDGIQDVFINRGALGGTLRNYPADFRARVGDELLIASRAGTFTDIARERGIEKKDCSGRHVRWVDFDRDGRLDLFINCQERGSVAGSYPKQVYHQRADGRFEDVAAALKLDLPEHELIDMVWFDADGDGTPDLFTHEDTGYFLYRRSGEAFAREKIHTGPFHRANVAGLKGNTTDYWQFDGKLSVADVDGDGRLDVFVASKRGNVLLMNAGGGRFRPVDLASVGLPTESVAAAWVDYDNDGRQDLHLVPQGLFRGQADGRFARTRLLELASNKYQAAVINWFDRDNDGDLDVVVALQENAALWRWWEKLYKSGDVMGKDNRFEWDIKAYRNEAPKAHWLQLELKGSPGNIDAIGAVVSLRDATGPAQVRQVGSQEGAYLSQGHYRLYFGLGTGTGPVSVDVLWPDGAHQRVNDLAADQRHTIRRQTP